MQFFRLLYPKNVCNTLFSGKRRWIKKCILSAIGFNRGEVPIEYIEQNFMSGLTDHVTGISI